MFATTTSQAPLALLPGARRESRGRSRSRLPHSTAPRTRDCRPASREARPTSLELHEIEERIETIECELALVAPLVHERARLLRDRAALRGERAAAPTAPDRIAREQVFAYLIRCPGSRAGEIAGALGCGQPAVSAHLQRGKGQQFSCSAGRWFPIPSGEPALAA
jgi:hypothetical protein